jgi:uncharacterized protein YceK
MNKIIVIAASMLALSACSAVIVLKNPRNGEIAQCNGKWDNNYAQSCANGYLADGWQRIN